MERTPVGKGRYLITHTSEEIQNIRRLSELSMHYCLVALSASQKESSTDPAEIQKLDDDIKRHYKIINRLMSETNEPISDTERQVGGVVHAVINENLPVEDAEIMLDQIYEQGAPVDLKTNH
jgi:CO dehydrogenase nickel-insertion accessory protein CooC1